MKRYTEKEKARGERAARDLSPKAYNVYINSDPLNVFEYDADGATVYATRGIIDVDGVTFDELEKTLEAFADA